MKKGKESPNFIDRTGEVLFNSKGYKAKIVVFRSAIDMDIQFDDGTISKNITYGNFLRGSFRNKNAPQYYGIGYIGEGDYDTLNDRKACDVWVRMLDRCYNESISPNRVTYKDVTVCEEWHCFQVFAEWFYDNYNFDTMSRWSLDKDIICPTCKEYSPTNCEFVPIQINNLFTKRGAKRGKLPIGVQKRGNKFVAGFTKNGRTTHLGYFDTIEEAFQAYKIAKEVWIKELAEKWKSLISLRMYNAICNYKIEITD